MVLGGLRHPGHLVLEGGVVPLHPLIHVSQDARSKRRQHLLLEVLAERGPQGRHSGLHSGLPGLRLGLHVFQVLEDLPEGGALVIGPPARPRSLPRWLP